ncbi:cache domain-containing sensor histidine kinase [Paenibacillus sacheonensis]|uniref:histidine kinase n=1 Tax=Paenibacillus sacheonensis TaxID=742054 RepID=A0A7X4YP70_9BACL|nr:sensor histidine kinase [Paenibacillus sacheonensis]NBC69995.1 HAMP domain-containing protein [Paenibacillus sacheonensis]
MQGAVRWIGSMFKVQSSMQKKLIAVFIFLIITPIIAISYISYQNYVDSINKNTSQYMNQVIANFQSKLEETIANMMVITKIPLYSTELQQYLVTPSLDLAKQNKIDFYIGLMNNLNKDMSSTYILDHYGNLFYRMKTDSVRPDLKQRYAEWSAIAEGAEGNPTILSTQEIAIPNHPPYYVFSVIRDIRDVNSFASIGTIVVDTKLDAIEQTVEQMDDITNGMTLIIDRDRNVIYDSRKQWIGKQLGNPDMLNGIAGSRGSVEMAVDGVDYFATYNRSDVTGWSTIVYIPVDHLHHDAKITRNVTTIATVLIVIAALVVSIVISFRLSKPLRTMTNLMIAVQQGNLDISFRIKNKDEVGVLGLHFNRMLRRIKDLIDEIYVIQNRKKEAELEALQSQINPHFIYNTLETIRMKALLNDDTEVSDMTFILGKLMQYSINRGKETVTVQEELQHLDNYLNLLKYRFKNQFQWEAQLPPDVLRYDVLKLTFQPIVENAILHGLEGKKVKVHIRVFAKIAGERLHIYIQDEGNGIPPDILQHLQLYIGGQTEETAMKSGIGLKNINERIKLYYGEAYGVSIDSRIGEGTIVTLALPYPSPNGLNGQGDY